MEPKLVAPIIKKRIITLEYLPQLSEPSVRQILDLLKQHIIENQLQDENHRYHIIVDGTLRKVFNLETGFITVNDLHDLAHRYLVTKNVTQ